jgi:16S rRNA (guanine(966)-N(2))-methyltransferase RsmD
MLSAKMRITGGTNKGQRLSYPRAGLRPTRQDVKQAIFNMLRPRLSKTRVLDLFCGAGALGIEALSAGAESVVFVEQDRRILRYLRDNVRPFGPRASVIAGDVLKAIPRFSGAGFDIILADPPYEQGLDQAVLDVVANNDLLRLDGLLVLEHGCRDKPVTPPVLKLLKTRTFGDTVLSVYRRTGDR